MRCMRFLDSAFCSLDNLSISSENLEFQSVIATFRAVLVALQSLPLLNYLLTISGRKMLGASRDRVGDFNLIYW